MFCINCGKEVVDNCINCPNCGKKIGIEDNANDGWCCLGCCIPLVGLILYFNWKKERPKTAKKVIIGTIIGGICFSLYYLIPIIFYIFMLLIAIIME